MSSPSATKTDREVADRLRKSLRTVRTWARNGEIPSAKGPLPDGSFLFDAAAIESWLASDLDVSTQLAQAELQREWIRGQLAKGAR